MILNLLFSIIFASVLVGAFYLGFRYGLTKVPKQQDGVELTKNNAESVKELMEWMTYYGTDK